MSRGKKVGSDNKKKKNNKKTKKQKIGVISIVFIYIMLLCYYDITKIFMLLFMLESVWQRGHVFCLVDFTEQGG